MELNNAKAYNYTVTLSGNGGDFFFLPLNEVQASYWGKRSCRALFEHLNRLHDYDGTPKDSLLPNYEDLSSNASGLELESSVYYDVCDANGEPIFENYFDERVLGSPCILRRVLVAPPAGVFVRTYERMKQVYELELTAPFDEAQLGFGVTETPMGALVNHITYAGEEITTEHWIDKEWARRTTQLLV